MNLESEDSDEGPDSLDEQGAQVNQEKEAEDRLELQKQVFGRMLEETPFDIGLD